MRKLLLSIAAVSFLAAAAAQTRAPKLLDDALMKELAEKRTVTRALMGREEATLIPAVDSKEALSADIREFKATVGAEVLRLIPGKTPGLPALLTALASASTMKGATYWSVTHNERRVLFLESYVVDSPQHAAKLPDPVFSVVPGWAEMYTFQEDTSFGRNFYRTVFMGTGDQIRVRTENTSAVSYFFIPVIPAGGLVNHTVVVPTDHGLVFYGAALLRPSLPIGDAKSRAESLMNRVIAAADWLETRLEK